MSFHFCILQKERHIVYKRNAALLNPFEHQDGGQHPPPPTQQRRRHQRLVVEDGFVRLTSGDDSGSPPKPPSAPDSSEDEEGGVPFCDVSKSSRPSLNRAHLITSVPFTV